MGYELIYPNLKTPEINGERKQKGDASKEYHVAWAGAPRLQAPAHTEVAIDFTIKETALWLLC